MFYNVFADKERKIYLIVSESELSKMLLGFNEPISSDKLFSDLGYKILTANIQSFKHGRIFMKKHFPEYQQVSLEIVPTTINKSREFVNDHHRHHMGRDGHKFSIALTDGLNVVGVAVASIPVSRHLNDNRTLEVSRLCVLEGFKNGCSKLYAAIARIAKEMGYKKVITYTLESEPGTSLLASGWEFEVVSKGGSWNSKSRRRTDKGPTSPKKRWARILI